MTIQAAIKAIENFIHGVVDEVDTAIEPGVAYLKANAPAAAIALGEAALSGAEAGSPWAGLVAGLITQAEAAGITLTENAAKVVLNTAQNNIIAKEAAAAPAVAVAPVVAAAPVANTAA